MPFLAPIPLSMGCLTSLISVTRSAYSSSSGVRPLPVSTISTCSGLLSRDSISSCEVISPSLTAFIASSRMAIS